MYAVIKIAGKQYKVSSGDVLKIHKIDAEAGQTITINEVLLLQTETGLTVGTPMVANASVQAEVLEQTRGEKIIVFKKRRRHNSRRKNGHRQYISVLRIKEIQAA
jgi:large subunit ribosomal protein L21